MRTIIAEAAKAIVGDKDEVVNDVHSSNCALWRLPRDLAEEVTEFGQEDVDDADLAEWDEGNPREDDIHVTILYGIEDVGDIGAIREIAKGHEPIVVEFGKLSLFENDDDVLKIDVVSKGLERLHTEIRKKIPNIWTHDKYHPHVTVAYLKKGRGKKYVDIPETEMPLHGKAALVTDFVVVDKADTPNEVELAPSKDAERSFVERHYDSRLFRFLSDG